MAEARGKESGTTTHRVIKQEMSLLSWKVIRMDQSSFVPPTTAKVKEQE